MHLASNYEKCYYYNVDESSHGNPGSFGFGGLIQGFSSHIGNGREVYKISSSISIIYFSIKNMFECLIQSMSLLKLYLKFISSSQLQHHLCFRLKFYVDTNPKQMIQNRSKKQSYIVCTGLNIV
jgi:hypothetical protein